MTVRLFLACSFLSLAAPAHAGVIGIYDFTSSLPSGEGSVIADYVPNVLSGGTTSPIRRMINGASHEDANAFGVSTIGTNLGRAGLVFEPTSGSNNFAFWLRKDNVMDLPNWSILYWVNRRDLGSDDYLFYVGVSDGRGGASAETSIYSSPGGLLRVENFTSSSGDSRDMLFEGGSVNAGTWHQLGLVREGASFSLFLDGELIGSDPSTAFNSFNVSSNTVMVLGGYKSGTNYKRMLDGMIDQVEVYDEALTQSQILERYNAIAAVPEASSFVLLSGALAFLSLGIGRKRSLLQQGKNLRLPASIATLLSLAHLGCGDTNGSGEKSAVPPAPPTEQTEADTIEWHYKMGKERIDGATYSLEQQEP